MQKLIYKIFFLLVLSSCVYEPPYERIGVFNNSSSTVYGYYSCSDSIGYEIPLKLFNNTTSRDGKEKYITAPHYRLSPYSRFNEVEGLYSKSWKSYITNCPDKTLKVFFISEEVMKNNTWSEIVKGQLYLKRIKVTLDELEKNDWLIEYKE